MGMSRRPAGQVNLHKSSVERVLSIEYCPLSYHILPYVQLIRKKLSMTKNPLRIDLPYCLERIESGRFILLNRDYKPIGSSANAFPVRPIALEIAGLTPKTAASISVTGDPDCGPIYLFNDGSAPWLGHSELLAYERRLARLLELAAPRSVARNDGARTGSCTLVWTSLRVSLY
jgi:hypothetical protein